MNSFSTKKIVLTAILMAIMIICFYLPSIGVLRINYTLVPIILCSILVSPKHGLLLGIVSGLLIPLINPDMFLTFQPFFTFVVTVVKGGVSGFLPGFIYRKFKKENMVNSFVSSISTPISNTLIFILGCFLFFYKDLNNFDDTANIYDFLLTIVGLNFLIEVIMVSIFSTVLVRIIKASKITIE